MQHNRLRLFLISCLACACTATPKYEYRTPAGIARSDDADVARQLALLGNQFSTPVCAALGVEPDPPFVIHHLPELPVAGKVAGVMVARDGSGRITARRIAIADFGIRFQTRFVVAHELVHWYAIGVWNRLPHAVEEGLADYIAMQCVPELRASRAADHGLRLAEITPERRARTLALTEHDFSQSPEEAHSDAYTVGFEIVNRVGIEGLRELCLRAENEGLERVPIEWLGDPQPLVFVRMDLRQP